MAKLFLLFSHTLSEIQQQDAMQNWGITDFVALPLDIQHNWSNVPADSDDITNFASQFTTWLEINSQASDYVLVQGEYGLGFWVVSWCLQNKRIPIYATTDRVYTHRTNPDGSIENTHIVKHVRFRKYPFLF